MSTRLTIYLAQEPINHHIQVEVVELDKGGEELSSVTFKLKRRGEATDIVLGARQMLRLTEVPA